jgi:hypothetical protein
VKSTLDTVGAKNSMTVKSKNFDDVDARLAAGFQRDMNDPGSEFSAKLREGAIVDGVSPDMFVDESSHFGNANMCQDAALRGDVRLMEAVVALGASVDKPAREIRDPVAMIPARTVLPAGSTALVMTCVVLAIADSSPPSRDISNVSSIISHSI